MPLFKCSNCQHEWEGGIGSLCDWCGAEPGRVLEERTSFERYVDDMVGNNSGQ